MRQWVWIYDWLTVILYVCVFLNMHVMYWCAENLLSHFFVTQPSPIWQLNIKKLSCRSNTVWVMAFGTVWLCVLKPAWSWCFWLSLDHNEQQIWIAVIHKPTLPCVVCGWVGGYECVFSVLVFRIRRHACACEHTLLCLLVVFPCTLDFFLSLGM